MTLHKELRMTRPFGSPEQEAMLNLNRTHSQVSEPIQRFVKSRGLSVPLYNILRILRGQGDSALTCSQIGERMVTREPDVTRLLTRLESLRLVRRRRSPDDGRVVLVSITPAGLKQLADMDGTMAELHREILGHLDRDELKELNRLLVKARRPRGEEQS